MEEYFMNTPTLREELIEIMYDDDGKYPANSTVDQILKLFEKEMDSVEWVSCKNILARHSMRLHLKKCRQVKEIVRGKED